jgi:plastocyanin
MRRLRAVVLVCAVVILTACSGTGQKQSEKSNQPEKMATPVYFKVDPATAGVIKGSIQFTGKRPARTPIDMSNEPACVEAHRGRAYDESVVVNPNGTLANVFVYVKSGLEGTTFEPPAAPVTIDQQGCWFHPRVMGIQVGQVFHVTNSDPVTHNIHPLAQINREWNHSQGAGDPQLTRKFTKPEIMVPVKCNIHRWMHAFIGVLPHPYFAVTNELGTFELPNVPPGNYDVAVWHEKFGTQEKSITVTPSGTIEVNFAFKGQ